MSEKPASLLTKTQRRRLETEFEGVNGAKRRRDRQRIRKRVAAGLDDFEYLVTYPDDQLELALDDVDDEELVRTLADLHLVVERVRTLRDVDEDSIVIAGRDRVEDREATVPSLEGVNLLTRAERREAAIESIVDEVGPTPWRRRGDVLLKIGLFLLLPAVVLTVVAPGSTSGPIRDVLLLASTIALLGGLSIVGIDGTKNDLPRCVRAVLADPSRAIRGLWTRNRVATHGSGSDRSTPKKDTLER